MARRTRGRFVRPQPRTKMWIGQGVGISTLTASSKNLVSTLSAGALLLRPFTILRTHMEIVLVSDQEVAVEFPACSYGEIVVTDTAAAIGVTAVPNPSGVSGDPEADWYVWQAMFTKFLIDINGTDGIGLDADAGHHYVIDSKAMRKVGPDDDVVAMATMETAFGAVIHTNGRQLIQLH